MKRGGRAAKPTAAAAAAAEAAAASAAAAATPNTNAASAITEAAATPAVAPMDTATAAEVDCEPEDTPSPPPPRDPTLNQYHAPLIGPEYQVEVGPFVSPPSIDPAVCTTTRHSPDGKPITINAYFAQTAQWNPHLKNLLADRRKSDALEKYLHNVETLFYKDARHVGHEVALRFLHQCEYDMPMANRMLKPWAPPADPEVDLDEEEMYPADPFCSVCRDGGNLMLCDVCDKSYHAACVQLDSVPAGTWTCPYHHCAACSEGIDRNLPSLSCSMCPTSFCSEHIPPDLRTRSDRLGCQEVMCVHCLEKEEEYEFIQRSKGKSATENSCRRAFLHRLQMVLKREGSQLTRLPIIGGRELDLYQLYTQVCKSGGIYAVLDSVGWKEIRRALRLPPTVHHQSALLKQFYLHLLYPYEKQFFPFFVQLPLKKAMATKDDDEEEEELALIAAQMAAAVPPPKKKGKSAAQQLVEEYQSSSSSSSRPVDPNVKDDTKPEDVLISLKIVGTTSMSKAKSLKGKKKAREKKKEERAREKEAREREKQKAKEKEKKTTTGKNQRAKRGRRGAASEPPPPPAAPLSAAAAAAAVGVKAPLKEHAAINIWSPTWWAQQANSSASVLRHAAAAASTTATNGPQVIDQEDIQNAVLAAAMAAANDTAAASATPSESITDRVDQPDMEVDQTDADANTQSNNNNDDDTTIADATPALASSDDAPAAAAVSSLPPSSPPAAAEPAPSVPSPALPPAEPVSTHSDVATTKRKYQEMLLASQTPVEPPAADVAEPVAVVEEHTDAPVVEPAAVPDTTNTDTTMADAAPTPVEAPAPSSPPLNDSTDAAPVAADPVPTAPAAADIISDTPADTAAPPQADDTTLPIVDDDNDSEAQANKRRKTSGASLQE